MRQSLWCIRKWPKKGRWYGIPYFQVRSTVVEEHGNGWAYLMGYVCVFNVCM